MKKTYRVSYINTLKTDKSECITKVFNTLESATDFVYGVDAEYKKCKLTKLYSGNYEVFKSSIEIEEITTVSIFNKSLMVDISELKK